MWPLSRLVSMRKDDFTDWNLSSSPTLTNDMDEVEFNHLAGDTGYGDESLLPEEEDQDGGANDWGLSPVKKKAPQSTHRRSFEALLGLVDQFKHQLTQLHELHSSFIDEFKYKLISSSLIDEDVLVSKLVKNKLKYQKSLNNLNSFRVISAFSVNSILNSMGNFSLSSSTCLTCYQLLSLAKSQCLSTRSKKLILVFTTIKLNLVLKNKLIFRSLQYKKLHNCLNKFLRKYSNFEILIKKLYSNYKKSLIFPEVSANTDILKSLLVLQNNSVANAISLVLNFVNLKQFENYCLIYNIDYLSVGFLNDSSDINQIFQKFNILIKLLLCQLLSLGEYSLNEQDSVFDRLFHRKQIDFSQDKWSHVITQLCNLTELTSSLLNSVNIENPNGSGSNEICLESNLSEHTKLLNDVKKLYKILLLFDSNDKIKCLEVSKLIESLKQNNISVPRQRSLVPKRSVSSPSPTTSPATSPRIGYNKKRLSSGISLLTVTEDSTAESTPSGENYLDEFISHDQTVVISNFDSIDKKLTKNELKENLENKFKSLNS